jgi:hypothetical protein
MFNLKSAAELMLSIAGVRVASAAYVGTVQECVVHVIGHAIQHGDVTAATELVNAVRKHDAPIVVSFFEKHGPFRWQKADKAFEKNKAWKGEFNPEALPSWETGKPIPQIKSVFDADEAFDRFIKSARATASKAKSVKNLGLFDMLEETQALFNRLNDKQENEALIARMKARVDAIDETIELPGLKAA